MHLTPALLSTGWGWVGSGSERPSTATWPHIRLPCSAGGTGVLLNVDRVAEQLQELGYPAVQVRGLADSGWFLDNKQYRGTDCIDTITCAPTEAIRRGIRCTCWDPFQGAGTHAEGHAEVGGAWGWPNLQRVAQVLEGGGPRALPAPVPGGRRVELLLWLQSLPDAAL